MQAMFETCKTGAASSSVPLPCAAVVLRRALIAGILVLAFAPSASAAGQVMLTPRITYDAGALHLPGTGGGPHPPWTEARRALRPPSRPFERFMLGRETVTSMQRRVSSTATVAGVNGDFFWDEGLPTGMHMESGSSWHRRIRSARASGSRTTARS